jgi:hypothetical protein
MHSSALSLALLRLTVSSLRSCVQRHGSRVQRRRISPYTTQCPFSQLSSRKARALGHRQRGITPSVAGIICIVVGTTPRTGPGMRGLPRVPPITATTASTRWTHINDKAKRKSLEKDRFDLKIRITSLLVLKKTDWTCNKN